MRNTRIESGGLLVRERMLNGRTANLIWMYIEDDSRAQSGKEFAAYVIPRSYMNVTRLPSGGRYGPLRVWVEAVKSRSYKEHKDAPGYRARVPPELIDPNWPGSVNIFNEGDTVSWEQVGKHLWRVEPVRSGSTW